ncbi:phage baseplate upper protein [Enterococcus faecium]
MANQDLFFDITKAPQLQPKQQAIYGRVGDGGLKGVTVKLFSNGYDYDITGLNPVFEGVKPDGTRIIDNSGGTVLDPQGGVFRYVFPGAAFTAKGDYAQAFFKLMRGDQVDSTVEVMIHVAPNLVEMGINSTHFITEYKSMIQNLNNQAEGFKNDLIEKQTDWNNSIKEALAKMGELAAKQETLEQRLNANDIVSRSDLEKALAAYKDAVLIREGSQKLP